VSYSRRPGIGAIVVLLVAVILLVTGQDDDEGDRQRGSTQHPSPTQPDPADARGGRSGHEPGPTGEASEGTPATVTRVVDGDTVEVAIGGETEDVRYIGVDTPETVAPGQPVECFGKPASHFNQRLVDGERVRLVFDDERRDRYGRLLAYVHLGPLFVNAELVRRGYARTLAIAPNTDRAPLFDRLAQAAGDDGRGLWGAC
jgi:micrococcal nuclease